MELWASVEGEFGSGYDVSAYVNGTYSRLGVIGVTGDATLGNLESTISGAGDVLAITVSAGRHMPLSPIWRASPPKRR
ncbi:MAG: hypothetical protein HC829_06760 [Bacteroidales bacterium]|nr:hypothetical protein [Bacteroidales bacterium]